MAADQGKSFSAEKMFGRFFFVVVVVLFCFDASVLKNASNINEGELRRPLYAKTDVTIKFHTKNYPYMLILKSVRLK